MKKSAVIKRSGKFDEDYKPKQRQRRRNNVNNLPKRRNWKINKNKWNSKENNKYVEFLKQQMQSTNPSWSFYKRKFYYRLGVFIKSRTTNQCRTHHRKMFKNYQSFLGIIQHLKSNCIATPQQKSEIIQQNLNNQEENEESESFLQIQKQEGTKHTIQYSKKQSQQKQEIEQWKIIDQKAWINK